MTRCSRQRSGTTAPSWIAVMTVLVGLVAAGPASAASPLAERLGDFWRPWLDDVGLLLSDGERQLFLSLDDDRERERFVDAFWESRGDTSLERWHRNVEDAKLLRLRSSWSRRTVLLAGKPIDIESYAECRGRLRPLVVWKWEPWQIARQGGAADSDPVYLIFVQTKNFDPRSLEPWDGTLVGDLTIASPSFDDVDSFLAGVGLETCFEPRAVAHLETALRRAVSLDDLRSLVPWPVPRPEWLVELRREIEGEVAAPRPGARLELSFPGTAGRSTIVHGRVRVDLDRLRQFGPSLLSDRVTIVGDIFGYGGRLVDSFEIVHHVLGSAPKDVVYLDFYRRLRPATYELVIRIADRYGRALLRDRRALRVPKLDQVAPPPAGHSEGYSRLTRAEVVVLDTLPSVEVLPIVAKGSARVSLHAITAGGPIAAVEFRLAGRTVSTDSEAPYSVEIELDAGRVEVEVVALDPGGQPLARHRRWVEREEPPFNIRFGAPSSDGDRIAVLLSLPASERLDRVECFRGRRLIATATSPFSCPLPARSSLALDYLRVAATLANGDSVERVLFLGPSAPEQIEVRRIELYVSVLDQQRRPVPGLTAADFRILDGGREQRLLRSETVENLPLNVAILMDISASMGRRARMAAASAQRFFENILSDSDRASLLAFNHDLYLVVPFTSDPRSLRHGASGLRGWGSTRLHDAIIFALYQYAGLDSRRALIVLSDGADVDSDFPFEQVLDAAVRAGVAVYPVSVLASFEAGSPMQLQQLAERTGGSAFVVRSIEELDSVYRRIEEELRSQYLLVYDPQADGGDLEYRTVEVEVLRAGVKTRNVHGYYP